MITALLRAVPEWFTGQLPFGATRSEEWPRVREEHLKKFPACIVCGDKRTVAVHHILPFHVHPERELDPNNLVTLCSGKGSHNHHLLVGHLGNYKGWNPDVRTDALVVGRKLKDNAPRIKGDVKE